MAEAQNGEQNGERAGRHAADSTDHATDHAGDSAGGQGGEATHGPAEAATVEHPPGSHDDAPTRAVGSPSPSGDDDATRAMAPSTGGGAASTATAEQPRPPVGGVGRAPASPGIGRAVRRVVDGVASALMIIGLLVAAVLVVFILLRIVGVNPENGVAQLIGSLANALVGDFRDLYLIPDPTVAVAVNYGLAALCWAVAGAIVARIVRALGRLVP